LVASAKSTEPWRSRLTIPNYRIMEAARYAGVSSQTVADWHSSNKTNRAKLSHRIARAELSYMQLIEVAVVAAFRKAGVPLKRIYEAREYVRGQLKSEYPFAQHRFKSDGRHILMDYDQFDPKSGKGKLSSASENGQLAWSEIMGRLQEFQYEHDGIALFWRVGGRSSHVVIDPRISFGAPSVKGVPTWAIKGRAAAGESTSEIADDFGIARSLVSAALKFEGVAVGPRTAWAN
jgi:uncharacterized protein (DUF433 family)